MTTLLTRRAMLAGFAATAGGLLVPEPRRVYSFLWAPESTGLWILKQDGTRIELSWQYAVWLVDRYRATWPEASMALSNHLVSRHSAALSAARPVITTLDSAGKPGY